ncbi:hypothetical protein AGABI2DRAFT_122184 [Agaricus bisporus var. bisporus H97]|uniref:hypothetical protein n=1 Tax=Agaricus bisporus var. bisporus (strain H97 / ATCC MYA-4626 / FGSC 10389) TaxID=936046 RepID=UPI00029F7AAA|nr:hypothetical protein AGABI2DRAFT_122184 [Agaricus bisporus var. bisporus H97]EKV43281.1 hypothetical protein AGABI2DRAFT_122184 [Agaricus bisporus var. bisporus H97]
MSKESSSRLPVEILEEIFSCAVDRVELHVPEPHCAGSQSPWNLALVCRDWWGVVLSTPYVWSRISLEVNPDGETRLNYSALLSAWNLCLNRSRSHPLTIKFSDRSDDGESRSPSTLFLEPLMEHVQRWETVVFSVSLDTLLPYLSNYPAQFTRLRRLCIAHRNRIFGECSVIGNPVGLFQDAPLLSCVYLFNLPCYRQRLGGVGIPWSQIAHLWIGVNVGIFDDLYDVLKNTPNLVTLYYKITFNYYGSFTLPPLELSHLEQVIWYGVYYGWEDEDPPATSLFFKILTAPRLSSLEVDGVCGDRELEAIQGCLQRSRCSVKSLTLPTLCLSSLLRLTPDIEILVFENKLDDENYPPYNSFDDDPQAQVELPHLRKVVLGCTFYEAGSVDGPEATSRLFGLLKAPQLSVLEVIYECDDIELEAIRDFLQRSRCSVKSLKVSSRRLSSFLSFTPDVESLVLPDFDKEILTPLLQKLTFDHSASACLCLKLKKIVLNFDIPAGPLFNTFIDMLKSRLSAPPNTLDRLRCSRLTELELGNEVPKHMKSWVQKRLPQEPLVITHARQVSSIDRWDL